MALGLEAGGLAITFFQLYFFAFTGCLMLIGPLMVEVASGVILIGPLRITRSS